MPHRDQEDRALVGLGMVVHLPAELPWISAIERFRRDDLSTRDLARQTLEEVARLTIVSFPHAIIPNKLLQEMQALARSAGFRLPLVEEVAADIFMGRFSKKYLRAARWAADAARCW